MEITQGLRWEQQAALVQDVARRCGPHFRIGVRWVCSINEFADCLKCCICECESTQGLSHWFYWLWVPVFCVSFPIYVDCVLSSQLVEERQQLYGCNCEHNQQAGRHILRCPMNFCLPQIVTLVATQIFILISFFTCNWIFLRHCTHLWIYYESSFLQLQLIQKSSVKLM